MAHIGMLTQSDDVTELESSTQMPPQDTTDDATAETEEPVYQQIPTEGPDEEPMISPFIPSMGYGGGAAHPTTQELLDAADMQTESIAGNPFFTAWFHPKRTARTLVNRGNYLVVPVLAAMSGITNLIMSHFTGNAGVVLPLSAIALSSLIAGSIFGLLGIYIGAAFLRLSASILGGKANYLGTTMVMAWANVPTIFLGVVLFGLIPLTGPQLFVDPINHPGTPLAAVQICLYIAIVVFSIWQVIIFWGMFSEAQGFSFGQTFACFMLTGLIAGLVGIVCFVAFAAILFGAIAGG